MKRDTLVWTIVLGIGLVWVVIRAFALGGTGLAYTQNITKTLVHIEAAPGAYSSEHIWVDEQSELAKAPGVIHTGASSIEWRSSEAADYKAFVLAEQANPGQNGISLSMPRTIGVWFAAFLTLCIFSFLYRDNPLYKLAESIFIGVSAAYWMVVAFWSVIVPNLIARLFPELVKAWVVPGLSGEDLEPHYWYVVPLILAVLLLWRLSPKGGWIARWPLAFFIGVFAGLRMITFIHGDFLSQIRNGIVPLVVTTDGGFDLGASIRNIVMVFGVLACLTYFFFSIEHKGVVGKFSRVGVWILMITFGAMFGFTVMGRITLLSARLEFLFDDWLWLIDPTGKRAVLDAVSMLIGAG